MYGGTRLSNQSREDCEGSAGKRTKQWTCQNEEVGQDELVGYKKRLFTEFYFRL